MDGIQALMPGQAPMPGQAAMPGVQPGRGGPSPGIASDRIPDLAKLNEQMLIQLFNLSMTNQIQKPSPISILSAISERQKQKQAAQAVAGALAQGENAQNQQGGTVAQQIIGPLMQRRAAQGGAMHGYADGGVVAFSNGGNMPPRLPGESFNDYRARIIAYQNSEQFRKDQEQQALENARKKQAQQALEEAERQKEIERRRQQGQLLRSPLTPSIAPASTTPSATVAEDAASAEMTSELQRLLGLSRGPARYGPTVSSGATQTPPGTAPGGGSRAVPGGASRAAPGGASRTDRPETQQKTSPPPVDTSPGLPAALQNILTQRESALRTRMGVPEDIAAGRAGIDALVRAQIEADERLARRREAEARELYEERLKGLGVDPLRLGAKMRTQKGQVISSLAEALVGEQERVRTTREAARKDLQTARREAEDIDRNTSKMRVLEAQRQLAINEKDYDRANAIQDQIAALQLDTAKLIQDYKDKQESLRLQGIQALAAKTQAEKPRAPTAFEEFERNRASYEAYLKAAAEAKTEGAISKALITEMIKNPLKLEQLKELNLGLYNTVMLEAAKMGMTTALPPNAPVRD